MNIRSLLRGTLAILAVSLAIMAVPASAAQVNHGYQASQDVYYIPIMDESPWADYALDRVAQVPIKAGDGGTVVRSTEPMKPLSMIYAQSLKTNGQSLAGYHRRC